MRKKFRRSFSHAAMWSPRLGGWSICFALIMIACHRFGIIEARSFFISIGLSAALALGGLGLAIKGFSDLWARGDKGGRSSIKGVIYSFITLGALMLVAMLWVVRPPFYDISTDLDNPPVYPTAARPENALPPLENFIDQADLQRISWPELSGRRYEILPERILNVIDIVLEENGWKKQGRIDNTQGNEILLQALARMPVLGFKSDIIIRVSDEDEATLVDMRVTARDLPHDFGFGAYIILEFMQALDREILLNIIGREEED